MAKLKETHAEVLAILYRRESDPSVAQYVVSSNRNDHAANLVNFNTFNRMARLGLIEVFPLLNGVRGGWITDQGREEYAQYAGIEIPARSTTPLSDPGPDAGHQFRFAVTVRGSYAIVGDPRHYDSDPDTVSEPFRLTVRAWSLTAACRVAAQTPLYLWRNDAIPGDGTGSDDLQR